MKKLFWLFLVSSAMVAGCSKKAGEYTPEPPVEPVNIPINIAASIQTRVTDTAFEVNDKVGVYIVNHNGANAGTLTDSGNYVDNLCVSYSGNWSTATPVFWKDQTTPADFYAYFPYSSAVDNVSAYPFSVQHDQNSDENYKASEFLWGSRTDVAPTADPIQITVKHAMSNLIIKLQAGQGYTEADLERASVTILGLKTGASINLENGVVTATGNVSSIIPRKEAAGFRALIVPQSISESKLIEVSIDGNTYSLTQSMTFETNKQHICTLIVNRINEGFNIGIGSWETDENDYGGTVK